MKTYRIGYSISSGGFEYVEAENENDAKKKFREIDLQELVSQSDFKGGVSIMSVDEDNQGD
jgi:hypothetical protein